MPKAPSLATRLSLITETGALLFVCCAAIGAAKTWKAGHDTPLDYAVTLAIPAAATVAFVLGTAAAPSLFAVGRIRFPLNLTLPPIYMAMVLMALAMISRIGTSFGNSITQMPPQLKNIEVWADARLLGICLAVQVLALSAIVALRKGDPRPAPTAEAEGETR